MLPQKSMNTGLEAMVTANGCGISSRGFEVRYKISAMGRPHCVSNQMLTANAKLASLQAAPAQL
jgi:hypothetical protein